LTEAELRLLAQKLGGIRELIAPKKRKETETIPDADLYAHLAKNPNLVRRPIIEAGDETLVGFTAQTREALAAAGFGPGQRRKST
jgi:arsenate reductase-like glutaredoxin family protein